MTTEAGFLNTPESQQTAIEQKQNIIDAAQVGAIRSNQFTYLAAFDGTNNSFFPTNGDPQNSNVAQLYEQAYTASLTDSNIKAHYEPGPGTEGTLTASSWLSPQVTQQVINAAENMYKDFSEKASSWINNNSDANVRSNPSDYIAVALTAFSRGDASAAIFSQMVYTRGLIDPATDNTLIPPGQIGVSAGVIFDSVTTGVNGNLAFAPSTQNMLVLQAENEYRYLFKGADYSQQRYQYNGCIGQSLQCGRLL